MEETIKHNLNIILKKHLSKNKIINIDIDTFVFINDNFNTIYNPVKSENNKKLKEFAQQEDKNNLLKFLTFAIGNKFIQLISEIYNSDYQQKEIQKQINTYNYIINNEHCNIHLPNGKIKQLSIIDFNDYSKNIIYKLSRKIDFKNLKEQKNTTLDVSLNITIDDVIKKDYLQSLELVITNNDNTNLDDSFDIQEDNGLIIIRFKQSNDYDTMNVHENEDILANLKEYTLLDINKDIQIENFIYELYINGEYIQSCDILQTATKMEIINKSFYKNIIINGTTNIFTKYFKRPYKLFFTIET